MKENNQLKVEDTFGFLWILLIGVALFLGYRTYTYMQQMPIETEDAALYQQPSVFAHKDRDLAKGSRVKVLKHKYNWVYVKTNEDQYGWMGTWMINSKYKNPVTKLSEATIVIDAGHGGADSGALSTNGKKEEKTFTLRYAKQLQSKLKKAGARVYMTRDSDKTVSLSKRPELAEKVHADAFISFHFDSSPQDNSASGYTTYYYHKDNGSFRLAKDINSQLTSLGLDNRGVDFGNFLVLRDNTQPAVLLESGYINSDRDLSFIDDSSYENKVTNDVVKGLQLYFEGKDENALIADDPN